MQTSHENQENLLTYSQLQKLEQGSKLFLEVKERLPDKEM
jgi:hypothetical protein